MSVTLIEVSLCAHSTRLPLPCFFFTNCPLGFFLFCFLNGIQEVWVMVALFFKYSASLTLEKVTTWRNTIYIYVCTYWLIVSLKDFSYYNQWMASQKLYTTTPLDVNNQTCRSYIPRNHTRHSYKLVHICGSYTLVKSNRCPLCNRI